MACIVEDGKKKLVVFSSHKMKAPPASRYLRAWRTVGAADHRKWQLDSVLAIGEALGTLTRKRGLRLLLKMMRRPAALAGLGNLQVFLEAGFDHFGDLAKSSDAVNTFLSVIRERETRWIEQLNTGTPAVCQAAIAETLTKAARNPT
jgi:hypothetical protein